MEQIQDNDSKYFDVLKSELRHQLKDTSNETSVRQQVLEEALSITTKDRNLSYGNPEDNFRDIAAFWQIYLDGKNCHGVELTPATVADLMILMKVARNLHKPSRDNYVDIAGYAACGAESAHV